jgi:tetratricopeptide (TPR) repeat protein
MSSKKPLPLLASRRAAILETYVERARQWARRNQRSVKGAIGGLTGLAVCITAVLIYKEYQHRQGLQALQQGLEALDEQQEDVSIQYLTRATNALSTKAVANALVLLHLGRAHARENEDTAAQTVRQQLVATPAASMHVAYLRQVALIELGREAKQAGDLSGARRWYQQAADAEGPLRAEAITALGYVLESLSERVEARLQYERLVTEYTDSPLTEVIREKIEP